jgi:hypothetical protein
MQLNVVDEIQDIVCFSQRLFCRTKKSRFKDQNAAAIKSAHSVRCCAEFCWNYFLFWTSTPLIGWGVADEQQGAIILTNFYNIIDHDSGEFR